MPELNDQSFYYSSLRGRLLGNKAREHLILQEMQKLEANEFFLEVGCAQGHFEKIALGFCRNVFGADCAFGKLPVAHARCPECSFAGINAERLPFKDKKFDFVLCTEVLEHVPGWKRALRELQRVSRKKVLITVPLENSYFWRAISKFSSMEKRGHLHKLGMAEIKGGLQKGWRIAAEQIIATPSRRLNRLIGKKAKEKIGMYALLLIEKPAEKGKIR